MTAGRESGNRGTGGEPGDEGWVRAWTGRWKERGGTERVAGSVSGVVVEAAERCLGLLEREAVEAGEELQASLSLAWILMAKRKQRLIQKSTKPKAKYNKKTGESTVNWDDEDACEQIKSPRTPISDFGGQFMMHATASY